MLLWSYWHHEIVIWWLDVWASECQAKGLAAVIPQSPTTPTVKWPARLPTGSLVLSSKKMELLLSLSQRMAVYKYSSWRWIGDEERVALKRFTAFWVAQLLFFFFLLGPATSSKTSPTIPPSSSLIIVHPHLPLPHTVLPCQSHTSVHRAQVVPEDALCPTDLSHNSNTSHGKQQDHRTAMSIQTEKTTAQRSLELRCA